MAQMIDLRDLLKHEILDLYSAEEQIIEALPKMIEKAANAELKKALSDHLKVTEQQKNRLDEIKGLMGEDEGGEGSEEKKGFFSKLFGGSGGEKCKGTEGLIKEGEKMMGEDMTEEVMDAAIIGAAQKIEHYEISGYGTSVAYARELGLSNVAGLLQQTLDEEYAADDSLTKLAVGKLNIKAENATAPGDESKDEEPKAAPKKSGTSKSAGAKSSTPSPNNVKSKSAGPSKATPAKKTSSKTIPPKKTPSKVSPAKKTLAKKIPAKKAASKASPAKKSPAKASPLKRSASKRSSSKAVPSKSAKSPAKKSAGKVASKSVVKRTAPAPKKGSNKAAKGKTLRRR